MTLPEKIGKYDIQGVLGEGGMGVVYRGFDSAIARQVAIKSVVKSMLKPEELKTVMGRFRHEAQAVGRLMHPGIIQIYDFGENDELAFIVMELVNGKTLAQYLAAGDTYEMREAGEIILQLLDGMGHAHLAGVVHRDIKPSNILVNKDGRIKISDFGIARTEASDLTQVGDVLGTWHYMSPEQFLGTEADARADLYAIGVIAYELLAGRKPFVGDTAVILQQVLHQEAENPSHFNVRLSPLLDRVLKRALAKNRDSRFQTAPEFAEALRDAIDASLALAAAGHVLVSPAISNATKPATLPPSPALKSAALLSAARMLSPSGARATSATGNADPNVSGEFPVGATTMRLDSSVKKARLLFIDDEERILTALKSQFRDRYHVFATTDGEKALDFITRYQMHVIVSDQRMPNMVGVELLRRSREISPNSVRILLTGYSDLAAIVGSINDGEVYRFISKPWDGVELQTIVAEAVTIALELADTKATLPALPSRMEAAILVVDQDEELLRVVRELIGGLCPVLYANSVDAAIAAMQQQEVAVVVTDVDFGGGQLTAMIKLLKQENPQILTIVATHTSDSEMVIDLINQAQIFRFLNKPVNVKMVRGHLLAALERYLAFKATPVLVKAQSVATVSVATPPPTSMGRRLLASIKSLRGRWFGA